MCVFGDMRVGWCSDITGREAALGDGSGHAYCGTDSRPITEGLCIVCFRGNGDNYGSVLVPYLVTGL